MLEISLGGNPGIDVRLESSSRRLRELYYTGGRKDFGNIVVRVVMCQIRKISMYSFFGSGLR
jgi:hypothetical protein